MGAEPHFPHLEQFPTMWRLLMAHQQESFLPFSSRQSLSCFLSQVAKRSNPKPRGPDSRPSLGVPTPPKPRGPNLLCQSCVVLSWHGYHGVPTQPKPHGPKPTLPKPRGPLLARLPCLGLNPSTSLPLQPHFQLLLQSVTPASIPYSSSFTGLP